MENAEDDHLIPLSALQHLAFCPRQCALIHIEQAWAENRWTAEGRALHEKCHEADSENRRDKRIARGLRLRSYAHGLIGVADVVEFLRCPESPPGGAAPPAGAPLPGAAGLWTPRPVEYKRGRKKPDHRDAVQLCGQALCLEEMLSVHIPEGDLYYGASRRRTVVALDQALRDETLALIQRLRALLAQSALPPPIADKKRCLACSLNALCMPQAEAGAGRGARYIKKLRDAIRKEEEEAPPCPPC